MKYKLSRRDFLTAISSATALGALETVRLADADTHMQGTIATTENGKIRGIAGGGVHSFLGVPYGGPADGAVRFMPPTDPAPWRGVHDCIKPGPRAMQGQGTIFQNGLIGTYFCGGRADAVAKTEEVNSENCLALNVLTPGLHGNRPVMVYLHGGGFTTGSGALTVISDRFVAEENVVLVGVNHRINFFGYTYLGDIDPGYADSGNLGQLDIIAALRWVKRNIAAFGGDPSNVTIFGESGGGAKVSCLLAMPGAKGLFHRAIVESGSATQVRTKEAASANTAKMFAELGLAHGQLSELIKMPAEQLVQAMSMRGLGSGPVVDGRSIPHQTWSPTAPAEAAGVPMIIGNCKDESTLFVGQARPELFNLTWDSLRSEEIKSHIQESDVDNILAAYRKDYPKDSPSDIYFRLSSDRGARRNAIGQAEAKLAQGAGQVFMYNFAWNTPIDNGKMRAFHTAELPLAMRLVAYPESEALSRQIAGAWAAFARSGDPSHKDMPKWEPYSLEKRATMSFDVGNTRLIYDPVGIEMELLKQYPGGLL